MSKITLRTEEKYTPEELAEYIVQFGENGVDEDTLFELIKHIELQAADENLCKRLAEYFTKEYKESLEESERKNGT